jgi:hypothetical protein
MNNRIKMTDSKFKCNIFLFLSVTVCMARLSMYVCLLHIGYDKLNWERCLLLACYIFFISTSSMLRFAR